jgi:hypothetical protein
LICFNRSWYADDIIYPTPFLYCFAGKHPTVCVSCVWVGVDSV